MQGMKSIQILQEMFINGHLHRLESVAGEVFCNEANDKTAPETTEYAEKHVIIVDIHVF